MKSRTGRVICLLVVMLPGIGWCVGEWRARRTDAEMRQRLCRQAVQVARTLSPEMVRQLSFTAADRGTPAFEFLRRQMTALGAHIPQRGIYTMALRDGRLVFGPENYPQDDPMASPPGTVYKEPAPDDLAVFTTGKPAVFGPTKDEYGTFVCALAPVVDPASGEVLMVVGIDTLAEDWDDALHAVRRRSVLAFLAVLGLVVAGCCWRRAQTSDGVNPTVRSGGARRPWATPVLGRHTSTGLLAGMGVLAVAFLGVVLLQTWHWTADQIARAAEQQVRLAVEFESALRDYVGEHIRPEMDKRVEDGQFIPEAMSTSFVARSVFDRVREVVPDTIVRFPSTNPRNPANMATPAEESLIRYFEQHPQTEAWSGVMEFFEQGGKHFVWAIPRRFDAGCLACHGRPEDAPPSLVERYGGVAGFGRSVGEVSIDLAAVPLDASYVTARTRIRRHLLAALGLCVFFLAGIALLIWVDVGRRRQSEAAIQKQKNLLRLVIDSIPGFVCVKSNEGRFVIANEALAKAYGATVAGVEGTIDTGFSANPAQAERHRRDDLDVMAARRIRVIPEEAITYADGTTHWLTTVKVPLIDAAACTQLLAVATDITDQYLAQQKQDELLRRLTDINEELSHFAYVVSHDLKAPLRGIKLIAEWLCADYKDKFDDAAKEQLDLLQVRVERMHNLIDGVLQYSRVGRIREEMVEVNLNELIPAIVDAIAPPEHIHIAVEENLPTVEGERTRITQVFQNLLTNAVKFMDKPRGEIHVSCADEGESWCFSVTDNGPGIESQYFDRIFRIFQTLAPRDEFESTGVGLTLVKKIVEMYGGRVGVESEVGRGSRFFFTLPKGIERTTDEKHETCVAGRG